MFSKSDIESLKRELEQLVGRNIIFRYNYSKSKEKKFECIIETVSDNVLVVRKVINKNIGLIESYTFIELLSGYMEIIDIK